MYGKEYSNDEHVRNEKYYEYVYKMKGNIFDYL